MIGVPSIFKLTHRAAALARVLPTFLVVVYYESIKRELKTKLMYECRCDERLKAVVGKTTMSMAVKLVSMAVNS